MTKQMNLDAEHEARCDLIDALAMIETAVTHGTLTEAEREVFGEWLSRIRTKYPQQKARRAVEPTAPRCEYHERELECARCIGYVDD